MKMASRKKAAWPGCSLLAVAKAFILAALRRNHPVIVCYTNLRTNRDHYVVAYKCIRAQYEKPGPIQEFFYIHDPSFSRNFTNLEDYLFNHDDEWVIHHLREFKP
jgi:hypothetical protein